ncbi:hypothetical protein H6P81_011934 [Aristolochia fimbriata]|uniref:Uncharacterized protein n=1 Tax=Aristolochia fimbriata TaxID=158543 RepID=A0AAV7EBN0_ARIFI|nr:hypothetical protein H6P81_011934 [Aristolochia fimbriata]
MTFKQRHRFPNPDLLKEIPLKFNLSLASSKLRSKFIFVHLYWRVTIISVARSQNQVLSNRIVILLPRKSQCPIRALKSPRNRNLACRRESKRENAKSSIPKKKNLQMENNEESGCTTNSRLVGREGEPAMEMSHRTSISSFGNWDLFNLSFIIIHPIIRSHDKQILVSYPKFTNG